MADTIVEEENIDTKNIFGDIKSDKPTDYEVRQSLFSILYMCWCKQKGNPSKYGLIKHCFVICRKSHLKLRNVTFKSRLGL